MEECRIIDYTEDWKEPLRRYMQRVFRRHSVLYVDYCIEQSSGHVPSLLVVNSKDEIVGCQLFFCTKVMINGTVQDTQWGHDVFLDKEYRALIGLDFMMSAASKKGFGIGLTEISSKIQKKLKASFIDGVFTYYIVNWTIVLASIRKLQHQKPNLINAREVACGGVVFKRIDNVSDINIPNDGFWYKGYYDLDFIRDATYLKNRFLSCKVHEYSIYASDDAYFVVRKSTYRGFPTMILSDFRYNPSNDKYVSIILNAVNKLAKKAGFGILIIVCGDKNVEASCRKKLHYKRPLDFVASRTFKLAENPSYSVTGGDSDAEFLK